MVAKDSCLGQTCTPECKKALCVATRTLDGSCCDQLGQGADAAQQCRTVAKTQIVPQMKAGVEQKYPSNFNFEVVLQMSREHGVCKVDRVLAVELTVGDVKQCMT